MPRSRVVVLALSFALGGAVPASAGTVFQNGGGIRYEGDPGVDNVVTVTSPSAGTIALTDTAVLPTIDATAAQAGQSNCHATAANTVTCDGPAITSRAAYVDGKSGNDTVTL